MTNEPLTDQEAFVKAAEEIVRLKQRLAEAERERTRLEAQLRDMYLTFVVSTDPIPPEDVERAAAFVRERGWVNPEEPA